MSDSVNTENRYPFLDFDGSDDFMQCENINFNGLGLSVDNTIFFISKYNDADNNLGAVVSLYEGSSSNRFRIYGRKFDTNDVRHASIHTDSTASGGDSVNNTASGSADSTTMAVRALRFHNKTSKWFINGTMVNSVTNSQYTNATNYDRTEPILIGADGRAINPDTLMNGSIQEIMIFNSSLSEEAIVKVSNYLNHKYNIY